jgi:alanine-synthesizing transaminase
MTDPVSTPDWPPRESRDFPRIAQLPPYVFAQVNEEKRAKVASGADVIDLGMGNPDLATPPHIVQELLTYAVDGQHHRYSASRGIHGLREAMAEHYANRYGVALDPEREVVVTIGAKEGIAHLMLAVLGVGDTVLVPSPAYPIHTYSVVFAGGAVTTLPLHGTPDGKVDGELLLRDVEAAVRSAARPPKVLILSFPHNPTTLVADLPFFERVVALCRELKLLLVHDFAYADIGFDSHPPSVLQVPGASEIAVEFFSMSKSYCMAGWRVGFCVGNEAMVQALTRVKSYLDYGIFQPIQIAAAHALRADQACVAESEEVYRRRRDALVSALNRVGWQVAQPAGTMFVWAGIPAAFRHLGSTEFARLLLRETGVVVSPGVGFGPEGDDHVRFALIEDEARLAEAAERMRPLLGA